MPTVKFLVIYIWEAAFYPDEPFPSLSHHLYLTADMLQEC